MHWNAPLPMNLKMPSLILNHLRILRFKGARRALVRGILTLTLSPSDGEREHESPHWGSHQTVSQNKAPESFSFSPSEGEKAGMRGSLD